MVIRACQEFFLEHCWLWHGSKTTTNNKIRCSAGLVLVADVGKNALVSILFEGWFPHLVMLMAYSCAQGSLLTEFREPYGMPEMEPRLSGTRQDALPAIPLPLVPVLRDLSAHTVAGFSHSRAMGIGWEGKPC